MWPFKRTEDLETRPKFVFRFEPNQISTEELASVVADIINHGFTSGGIPEDEFKRLEHLRAHFRCQVVENNDTQQAENEDGHH